MKILSYPSILDYIIQNKEILLTMDENQQNGQSTEDEIDLRELFLVLWKKKLPIICLTLIVALITGIVSVFFITPVYHSKLNIVINMPDTYKTKYGEYTLPITTNEQYINLITSNDIIARTIKDMGYDDETSIESIRDRISIDKQETKTNTEQNSFNIKVSADNPAEVKELAQTLFDNYSEFLDVMTIEGAVDYYINKFNVELSSLEVSLNRVRETLAKNEALLLETPQTINQGEAMTEIQNSPGISDFIILENVINPNYTKIENDIIENKQSINNIENSMRIYKGYLEELDVVKESVAGYRLSGEFEELDDNFISITKTNVYLPSDPIAPSRKTSPSNARNVIIGALLGGMIGVVAVFIKEYWFISK